MLVSLTYVEDLHSEKNLLFHSLAEQIMKLRRRAQNYNVANKFSPCSFPLNIANNIQRPILLQPPTITCTTSNLSVFIRLVYCSLPHK